MANILYIEDIQDNITLVERIVKSRGHEFQFARNAEEGLALAFASKPDLILLDSGFARCRWSDFVRLVEGRSFFESNSHHSLDRLA